MFQQLYRDFLNVLTPPAFFRGAPSAAKSSRCQVPWSGPQWPTRQPRLSMHFATTHFLQHGSSQSGTCSVLLLDNFRPTYVWHVVVAREGVSGISDGMMKLFALQPQEFVLDCVTGHRSSQKDVTPCEGFVARSSMRLMQTSALPLSLRHLGTDYASSTP